MIFKLVDMCMLSPSPLKAKSTLRVYLQYTHGEKSLPTHFLMIQVLLIEIPSSLLHTHTEFTLFPYTFPFTRF